MPARADELLELLEAPLAAAAAAAGALADPAAARAALERAYPFASKECAALKASLVAAVQDGVLCDKGGPAIRYSRLAKPSPATQGLSIDFVWMTGPGLPHRHPAGEMNLCWAVEGTPRFDGRPEGWVAFAPGSQHVPTVTDGRMLIAYFLPGGAVEWLQA